MAAAVVSGAALSARETSNQTPANTVTYRGCLNQGTGDKTYVLANAQEKGQKGKEKVTFKVVPATEKVSLERFLTNEVEVTGTLDKSAGTPSDKGGTLGTFTATKVSWRADFCG
jgi:hypothetical protein